MDTPNNTGKPKRRPRYKGTHPKRFTDKYKELNPEKYETEIKKILERGSTPAGSHRPICVNELLEVLKPKPGETMLDATLGYGGHAEIFLQKLGPTGRLIGVEQDAVERPKTEARLRALGYLPPTLTIAPINFREARQYLQSNHIDGVDIIMADLGVSSMQLDNPERGFSFKNDGPLDLRMNPHHGEPAWQLLQKVSVDTFADMLRDYSDEPRSHGIAKAIVSKKPKTTRALAGIIRELMSGWSEQIRQQEGNAPIRRAFQALRIAVNEELTALENFLKDVPNMLNPGGRVGILSFHSGEDRLVKKSFRAGLRSKVYSKIAPEFIRPSFDEQRSNSRSASAKLRWALK